MTRSMALRKVLSILSATAVVFLGSSASFAQLPTARLSSLSPPGAKAGTTVEVTIAGQDLDLASQLLFTHGGIKAAQKMRDPNAFEKGPQPVPNVFTVTVAGDVPPGKYEARAVSKFGISSSRYFQVSDLNEVAEKEANNSLETAQEVPLESIASGLANGGADLDFFKVALKAGQRIVVECYAERLDSRMDATLVLLDSTGRQLESNRNCVGLDPVIDFTAPVDGAYVVKLYDFVYGGGGDYFYRLCVSTRPHVDYVLPPAGVPGTKGAFTLYGRNLPGGQPAGVKLDGKELQKLAVQIDVPAATDVVPPGISIGSKEAWIDGFEYRLQGPTGASNAVLIGFATAPAVVETEPNNAPGAAQKIAVPGEVAGQFQSYRDVDYFDFEAKTGQQFVVELCSQRLGSPADPYFLLQRVTKNEKGEEQTADITATDDAFPNVGGVSFNTQSDDGAFQFAVPADGTYRLIIRDLYNRGDPRYVYRLAVRPPAPDFRLVAVSRFPNVQQQSGPWSPLLRRGGTEILDVYVLRRDGFTGEVQLAAEGLPPGVACPSAVIGPNMNSAPLVLAAAEDAPAFAGTLKIVGKAQINGAEVARIARGGQVSFLSQQNQSPRARLSGGIPLAVSDKEKELFAVSVEAKTFEMSRAGTIEVPVKMARRDNFKGNVALQPVGQPPNVQVPNINLNGDQVDGKLQLNIPGNAPVGTYTFYLLAQTQVPYRKNADLAEAAEQYQKEIEKIAADAKTAADKAAADAKTATDAKAAADKASADAAAKAKTAADAKAAADKASADAVAKAKAAADAKTAADKAAADATTKAKAAADAKTAADKASAEAAEKAKVAADKLKAAQEALDKDKENKALQDAKAAAEKEAADTAKAAADAVEKVKTADAAKVAADKAAADAAEKAKAADAAKVAADKAAADAAEKVKTADAEKVAADKAAADAVEKVKTADAAKIAADKVAADMANVQKAADAEKQAATQRTNAAKQAANQQNIQVFRPSSTITIKITEAPITLAAPQAPGALKQGQKIEVPIAIARLYSYAEQVQIEVQVPSGVQGLKVTNVNVEKDKNEAKVTIEAAANATQGTHALTVRATARFNNQNLQVTQPLSLKVE
ncbi:MAG: pre-peptidase C-terminal domain-containing protein [Planctomycetia bacterium]|nr:pre-peptidase C-terminal domain-containing protein [Planctomycetia bacterium]